MATFAGAFPDSNIPDSQKKEEYHKQYATSILNQSIDGRFDLGYQLMQESYDFYDGLQETGEYSFLQESESGDNMPAIWINYNSVRTKVDVLVGELSKAGYDISVRAINKDAASKRLEKKYDLAAKMMMKDDLIDLQNKTGLPLAPTENLPETEEELEDYIEYVYKDDSEKVMKAALVYLAKKYEWERKRLELFRDLIITGRCFAKTKIVEGMVHYERVDPRYMIFDNSSRDELLRDSAYFGWLEYMPIAQATQEYNLTEKELEGIGTANGAQSNSFLNLFNADNTRVNPETSLEFVSGGKDNVKALVFHAQWQDTKKVKRKVSTDKYGNKHYKKVKDTAKGKDIKKTPVKTWRKCTLIGGNIVRDWGLNENMVRSIDDLYDTRSNFVSLVHNFVNGRTVSKVDLIKGLQKFKNMSMYNCQLAMNRAGAKGFMYDISAIPDEWNVDDVLYYLKTAGIGFYNSMKDGISRPNPGLNQIDMTISQSINQYVMISQQIDQQIDEITGINEARVGQVASASQAVGVTQSAINSSQLVTEPLFKAFQMFSDDLFSQLAALSKIIFKEQPESFSPIIGDSGIDFMKMDADMHLQDYGVFIHVTPPALQDEARFEQMMRMALQSGEVSIADVLDFMNERDTEYKIRKLQRVIKNNKAEEAARQQELAAQQQEAQAQAQMASQQQQSQLVMQEEQAKGMRRQQEIDQTHNNRMKETITKERLNNI